MNIPEIELDEYQDEQSEEARRVQQIIDELDSPDDFNEGP